MSTILMCVIILWWVALAAVLLLMVVTGFRESLYRHSMKELEAAYNRGRVWAEDMRPYYAMESVKKDNAILRNENNQLRKKLFPGKC